MQVEIDVEKVLKENRTDHVNYAERAKSLEQKFDVEDLHDVFDRLVDIYEQALDSDSFTVEEEYALSVALDVLRIIKNR